MHYKYLLFSLFISMPTLSDESLFHKYPAKEIFKGTPAKVDFSSNPDSKRFKSSLTQEAKKGPNFAGSFIIASSGCGTSCEDITILSTKTGKILDFANSCGDHSYRLTSNLLIINPPDEDVDYPSGCATKYYLWNGEKLNEIRKDS